LNEAGAVTDYKNNLVRPVSIIIAVVLAGTSISISISTSGDLGFWAQQAESQRQKYQHLLMTRQRQAAPTDFDTAGQDETNGQAQTQ
jgi:hypothetical protein